MTIVALDEDNNLLGFASLIEHDMETHLDLSPWLAALYVLSEHRRKGIGEVLAKRIIIEAKKLNIKQIFLFTSIGFKVDFYSKIGWMPIKTVKYKGTDAVIMKYCC